MPKKQASTKPPKIGNPALNGLGEVGPASALRGDAILESLRFQDLAIPHLDLSGARLDEVQLSRITSEEVDLKGARFVDVALETVGLAVVRAARTQWRDVSISGRLGSLEAYESQWRSVHFIGCKLSFVNLRGAELNDVCFTDCTIEELDLGGAIVNRAAFVNSRLISLNAQDAKFRDFDLRGATLESIDGLNDLHGTTVSSLQLSLLAPLFAQHLGLKIED